MAKDKINDLLDVIYEIEGLAELAFKRDPAPRGIINLIKEKTSMLQEIVDTLDPNEREVMRETYQDQLEEEDTEADAEVEFIYSYDDEEEEQEEAPILHDEEATIIEEQQPAVEEEATEVVEQCDTQIDGPADEAIEDKADVATTAKGADIRKLFSINDKFRFKRELFSNRSNDFNDSLDLVTAMRSYAEAEDYFYNDLQWEPENEDVVEFMNKIQEYFSK